MTRYEATWDSLSAHTMPRWLTEAKFGIYTHWGAYSLAGCGPNGTWYPTLIYQKKTHPDFVKHHEVHYGGTAKCGYKDMIPQFTAEKFDPEQWAEIFKNSGAKFAGPVAIHHDHFAMWDSQINPWNAAQMGPKRDITGELAKAYRAAGMEFLVTFHHALNWWYYPKDEKFDTVELEAAGLYSRRRGEEPPDEKFLQDWLAMIREVVERYEPDLLWFDAGLGQLREKYRREMLAYYYNKALDWGKEVEVTYKMVPKNISNYNLAPLTGLLDFEVGKMNELTPHPWISDTAIDTSPRGGWSYVANAGFKSPERLIHNLIDRVSKNGHLLLSVGPEGDGTIPEGAQNALKKMGAWLAINGEAIYGTVPWLIPGEGPTKVTGGSEFNEENEIRFNSQDIRYTVKGQNLYATCLGRPGDRLTLGAMKSRWYLYPEDIAEITMLGGDGAPLKWQFTHLGLEINLPKEVPSDIAVCLKITQKA